MSFQKVSCIDDLWSGEMMRLEVDGHAVLLINVNNRIYAYADACPHQKSRLSEGSLLGTRLRCARHHWDFDVQTGKGLNPDNACLKAFPVAVYGRDIMLDLDYIASEQASGANET